MSSGLGRPSRRTALITIAALGAAGGLALGILSATGGGSAPATGPIRHAHIDLAGDSYPYAVYVPGSGAALPLVVVLHGCGMTADQQAAASQYDALAARERFAVLYPDVDALGADQGRCWKGIWEPSAEGRGRGDAAAIAAMTSAVMARWRIDRSRVYVIGISAGAYEASILGAVYPDLFAAIGIHSGAAYMEAQPGCIAGPQPPAATAALARAAYLAMGPRAHVVPVVVFHGDADHTVPYDCGLQALAQWLETDNLVRAHQRQAALQAVPSVERGAVPNGRAYTVASYKDRRGCPVAEFWTIHGMGHFWSGGSADPASALYSDPRGPSASAGSWEFFSRWRLTASGTSCK